MRYFYFLLLSFCLIACNEPEKTIPITPEQMIGTWYLIDRGPEIGDTTAISACEKREYLEFKSDYSSLRHQDCLPKTDTYGSWTVVDGKCMMRMKLVFSGNNIKFLVSDSTEQIEFKLIAADKIKVEKKISLMLVWGIYQKTP